MEHNDATDKDLPADPDATEIVPLDSEAMLHMELDAEKAEKKASRGRLPTPRLPSPRPAAGRPPSIATIRAMRAAPRASSSRFPISKSSIPRPPIHTLLPPRPIDEDDSDAAATRVFDRNSGRMSTRMASAVPPSVRSVAFPAATFSAPRIPVPMHTVPAIPAAKRVAPPAAESSPTAIAPVLAPTSRRDLSLSAFESLAPMAMSAFPSAAPPATGKKLNASSLLAIALTMFFTISSVAVMAIGILKPTAIDRAKIAIGHAMKGHQKHPSPPAVAAANQAEPPPAASIAVPPVLIDDMPADLGEKEAALFLPASAKGHRVFVDGKVLNENDTDARYVVAACGKHKVQIGSSGKEQVMDLPCHAVAHPE